MKIDFAPTRSFCAALLSLLCTHCGTTEPDEGDFVAPAGFSVAQLSRVPTTPGAFRREGAFVVTDDPGGDPSDLRLQARLSCDYAGGLRVATSSRPDAHVTITPDAPVSAARAGGGGCGRVRGDGALVAFEHAYGPGVTSIIAAGPRLIEEFVSVPSPEAMPPLRYRLDGGPSFGHWEEDEEGGLWAYANDGAPLVHVPPPALDDDTGVHVTGRWLLSPEGAAWSIEADLPDLEGLTYPLLVDPAFETPEWFRSSTTNEPAARGGASAAYHAPDGCVVLHGGMGTSSFFSDTRVRCAGAWQANDVVSGTKPSARAHAALASVPSGGGNSGVGIYLFGGVLSSGAAGDDELWRLRLTGAAGAKVGTWQRINRVGNQAWPEARYMHGMAWDGTRLILWGGVSRTGVILKDTWSWDGATWTQYSCNASTCFSPRYGFAQAQTGTASSPTIYAFGGYQDDETPPKANGGGTYTSTLQTFSNGVWTPVTVGPSSLPVASNGTIDNAAVLTPDGRYMAWFVRTKGNGLLGGSGSIAATPASDLWAWRPSGPNRWSRLPSPDPSTGAPNPGRRLAATAVYDESASETLLFGGWGGANGDTPVTSGRVFRSHEQSVTMSVTCSDSFLDTGTTCNTAVDSYTLTADISLDGGLVTDVLRARGYFLRRKNGVWQEIPSLLGTCGTAAVPLTSSLLGALLRLTCVVGWDTGVDAFAVRSRDQAYYGFDLAGLPLSGALCETAPASTTLPYCNASMSYSGSLSCTSLPTTNNASATCN